MGVPQLGRLAKEPSHLCSSTVHECLVWKSLPALTPIWFLPSSWALWSIPFPLCITMRLVVASGAVRGDDVFITLGPRHLRMGMGSPCSFSPTVTRTNNMNQSVSFVD